MEDQNRLAMESGTAAFEINYPFVYPSMKANKPALFKSFRWAPVPAGRRRPAVAADHRRHRPGRRRLLARHPDLAFEAALCLRNRQNQLTAALKGGLPPTLRALYTDEPRSSRRYPFAAEVLDALEAAASAPRPRPTRTCPSRSRTRSPRRRGSSPASVVETISGQIEDALESKGLIP